MFRFEGGVLDVQRTSAKYERVWRHRAGPTSSKARGFNSSTRCPSPSFLSIQPLFTFQNVVGETGGRPGKVTSRGAWTDRESITLCSLANPIAPPPGAIVITARPAKLLPLRVAVPLTGRAEADPFLQEGGDFERSHFKSSVAGESTTAQSG